MKSQLYGWGIELVFIGLMLSDLFAISELGYFDEIVGIVFGLLSIFYFLIGGRKMNRNVFFILLCMLGISGVGLISNMIYTIQPDLKVALPGAYLVIKQYLYGLFMLLSVNKYKSKKAYSFIVKLSKLMLLVLGILACVNTIFDLGMSGSNGEFSFLSQFGGTVSCWVILFLAICYCDFTCNRSIWFIIATITIVLTKSGLGLLGIGLLVLIYLFFERKKKFHWYYLIPIIFIIIIISWQEIEQYLLDSSAPRAELLIYAFVTANRYFPLGSGFSTYASSMAVSHYSELYYLYGFNNQWGMSKDNALFLMDSYYPMIVGETGYLGLCIFCIMIYLYIKKIIFKINNKILKNGTIFLMIFLLTAGLGFGTGSSWGCVVYMLIPLMAKQDILDHHIVLKE